MLSGTFNPLSAVYGPNEQSLPTSQPLKTRQISSPMSMAQVFILVSLLSLLSLRAWLAYDCDVKEQVAQKNKNFLSSSLL